MKNALAEHYTVVGSPPGKRQQATLWK